MKLTATFLPQALTVDAPGQTLRPGVGSPVVREFVNADPYAGEYELVPGDEDQILDVEDKRMTAPLVIKAVPQSYGRIAWNGAFLTVY